MHSDGYPEGLGVEIAECFTNYGKISRWEIEDLDINHGDLEYIYYVWQKPNDTTWISIFEVNFGDTYCNECGSYLQPHHERDKCIFVGEPDKLINKYKQNTNNDG